RVLFRSRHPGGRAPATARAAPPRAPLGRRAPARPVDPCPARPGRTAPDVRGSVARHGADGSYGPPPRAGSPPRAVPYRSIPTRSPPAASGAAPDERRPPMRKYGYVGCIPTYLALTYRWPQDIDRRGNGGARTRRRARRLPDRDHAVAGQAHLRPPRADPGPRPGRAGPHVPAVDHRDLGDRRRGLDHRAPCRTRPGADRPLTRLRPRLHRRPSRRDGPRG